MRVISLKNYCDNTRVVIQLLQYQNKVYLFITGGELFASIPLDVICSFQYYICRSKSTLF